MSFHAGGAAAGQTDILNVVLSDIFQLSQCAAGQQFGCISSDVATSLIFGLFLPHVVLLVYLYIITRGPQMFQEHSGLGTLFGLAVYVFLVFQGWYAFLAQWFVWWLAATIVFSLGYFFLTKIFHPSETGARFRLAKELGERVTSKKEGRQAIRRLEEHISDLEDDKEAKENELSSGGLSSDEREALRNEIADIEDAIRETRKEIRKIRDKM